MVKTIGFINQRHNTCSTAAKDKDINRNALGFFPVFANDGTLRGRRCEARVRMRGRLLAADKPIAPFPVNGMFGRRAIPSHQISSLSVKAQLVKMTFFLMVSIAIGLES